MMNMKECMKPHPLLHSLSGLGLGLLLAKLIPVLADNGLVIGIVLIVVAILGEMMMGKGGSQMG